MSYRMMLDDIRPPPNKSWTVVRSVAAAKEQILTWGMPFYISFDHDLGDNVPSGKDFANWLVESDLAGDIHIPLNFEFYVHSANPAGALNIQGLMSQYLAHKRKLGVTP